MSRWGWNRADNWRNDDERRRREDEDRRRRDAGDGHRDR